jgi:transcriptional repressor NrdR
MKCPFCGHLDNRVIDSRLTKESSVIRRRRECGACERRFTTYERVDEVLPFVVKKDGRREPFDRGKIVTGLSRACEKRPISVGTVERLVEEVEREMQDTGLQEVPAARIGQSVMERLRAVDQVAYVRFASVYRDFKDIGEFMEEVEGLLDGRAEKGP